MHASLLGLRRPMMTSRKMGSHSLSNVNQRSLENRAKIKWRKIAELKERLVNRCDLRHNIEGLLSMYNRSTVECSNSNSRTTHLKYSTYAYLHK